MRRRWSKAAIIRAIYILDLCAGTRDFCGYGGDISLHELGIDDTEAYVLAGQAFVEAPLHRDSWSATYAEAAGMLRDGWLPGDQVVLRRRHA